MYAKAKKHLQLAVCLHSKAIESITTRKSLVRSHWCIIAVSWNFRMIHRFCYLKCCWSASFQVFDACSADVDQVKQYHAVFAALNTSHCIVWLRELAVQGAETGLTAPVVFLVKTSVTFFTLADVVYSCSFLAVVSFSDLLLLQNTHMQPLN